MNTDDIITNEVNSVQQNDTVKNKIVHLRIQNRNNRKKITICQGLENDLNLKKILRYLKKIYSTNGWISIDTDGSEIIMFNGDLREQVKEFLTKFNIVNKDLIKMHGG